jgi:hypothetical protein
VTQKLALYFLNSQGNGGTRILDAEHQPEYTDTDGTVKRGWTVGRLAISAIAFKNPSTSKSHAVVSARVDKDATMSTHEISWIWELTDRLSTNGTFLEAERQNLYRLVPGVAYVITEGSIAQFGAFSARIKFSFDIDDTCNGGEHDTDPAQKTVAAVVEPVKGHAIGHSWADVLVVVLMGPEGVNPVLWWCLVLSGGLLALWIHKQ